MLGPPLETLDCVHWSTTMFVSREGLELLGHQARQPARRCGRRVGLSQHFRRDDSCAQGKSGVVFTPHALWHLSCCALLIAKTHGGGRTRLVGFEYVLQRVGGNVVVTK